MPPSGEAAYEHGYQAIQTRSTTGVDDVIAIFPESLTSAVLKVEHHTTWSSTDDLDL